MSTIGSRIKLLRKGLKLTQFDFASSIDIKQSPLSQIESDRILPSIDTLIQIKRVYKISYEWLLEGVHQSSSETKSLLADFRTSSIEDVKNSENDIDKKIAQNLKPIEKLLKKLINKLDGQTLEKELEKEIKASENKLKSIKN